MIKAIETIYNGYRFRSRLEARWAVFFDKLGIKYEYEPEGFHLSDGTKYLPDFFLPGYHHSEGVYVEVKPDGGDFSKAKQLARDKECSIILAEGIPDFKVVRIYEKYLSFTGLDDVIKNILSNSFYRKEYNVIAKKEITRTPKDAVKNYLKLMLDHLDDQGLDDDFYNEVPGIFDLAEKYSGRLYICPGFEDDKGYFPQDDASLDYEKAVLAAKQARFEHGENPR